MLPDLVVHDVPADLVDAHQLVSPLTGPATINERAPLEPGMSARRTPVSLVSEEATR